MQDFKECLFNNNGIWAFKYTIHNNMTGTDTRKSKSTGVKFYPETEKNKHRKSRREAEQIMREFLENVEGTDINADMYFYEWVQVFMEYQQTNVKTTTWLREKNVYENHILGYFKQHKYTLRELQPMHLNKFFEYLKTEKGLGNTTRNHIKGNINCILNYAVKNQVITRNVCEFTMNIPKSTIEYDWYDEDELKQLLAISKGTELETVIFLTVLFGLRREEVLGLRWSNIDLEKRILYIRGSLIYVAGATEKYQYLEQVKTTNSKSAYAINDMLYEYLVDLKEKQDKMERVTEKWKDFVCVRPNGDIVKPDFVSDRFPKLLKQHGMRKIRFHDLRHSCITLMSETCTVKELQAYARHGSFQTTMNIYTHVRDSKKAKMLDDITNKLFG